MFISVDELKDYTGLNTDSTTLPGIFCSAACNVVEDYLGYSPEQASRVLVKKVCPEKTVAVGALNCTPSSITVGTTTVPLTEVSVDGQYITFTGTTVKAGDTVTINCTTGWQSSSMPGIIKLTALRIAGCMAAESDGNIGISSKSFTDAGSRVFLNSKYDRYLEPVERYRAYRI